MKLKKHMICTVTLALLFALKGIAAPSKNTPKSSKSTMAPPEIWAGYNPRKEPLDEEVLKTWEENGVTYKEVYFNGEKINGKYVRIYGIYAAPTGAQKLPAILHIHGGGQTVIKRWLKDLTKQGYAVLTFNWGGEWPGRKRYTIWNGVVNGDHRKRKLCHVTLPTPRSDSYFLWTQASMRAITYLERQKEVDPEKIGAFGVSMGGSIMWNMAFDKRIKAGCAIYGAGWNTYRHYDPRYAKGHSPKQPSENDLRWRMSMAPEASAPYVHFPMLYLNGTNDHHGDIDRAQDTLSLIPAGVPRCWALTPRFRHHISSDFIHDLPAWMDYYLKGKGSWPDNPCSELKVDDDGIPVFILKPANSQKVTKVEVYYALENPFSVNRHWRNGRVTKKGDTYTAKTPVMNVREYLFVFANITYESGIVISSKLEAVIPEKLGNIKETLAPTRLFYNGNEGLEGWVTSSLGTDPIPSLTRQALKSAAGPGGKQGFTVTRNKNPWNYAPGDPGFRAPKGAALSFDVKTTAGENFIVKLHKNYRVTNSSSYACKVAVKPANNWQTITLDGDQFLNVKTGKSLGQSINEINNLELALPKGGKWQDKAIIFRNFKWVGGNYVPHVHSYRNAKAPTTGKTDVHSSDDASHLVDHEAGVKDALLENAKFNSKNTYVIIPGGFRKGCKLWADRAFAAKTIPEKLVGATYIKTPMADRSNKSKDLISFATKEDSTVYVGINDANKAPKWLSDWEKTDLVVNAVVNLIFYKKNIQKGTTTTLGSLYGTGNTSMYTVVIKPQE